MSSRVFRSILVVAPVAVLAFFAVSGKKERRPVETGGAPSISFPSPSASAVTVSVDYAPDRSSADTLVFQISLNTHSVDLDNIDFQKSVLLESSGQRIAPLDAKLGGERHHRSAEVAFGRMPAPVTVVWLKTPETSEQEFTFQELK